LHVSVLNLLEQGGTKKRNTEYVEKVKTTLSLKRNDSPRERVLHTRKKRNHTICTIDSLTILAPT